MKSRVSRPMLGRLPLYATCLEKLIKEGVLTVSSGKVASELCLGEVQVRKELAAVSGAGKPRVGYDSVKLLGDVRRFLGANEPVGAVIIGAGRLGCALLEYEGFEEIGVLINAAFDINPKEGSDAGKNIYPVEKFSSYCKENSVQIGVITVPASEAQRACDMMVEAGIKAIWNFAPTILNVPHGVSVVNEKLAISLSQLRQQINK